MLKYSKAFIEVVDLAAEDVVLTSGCPSDCPEDDCRADSGMF